MIVSLKPKGREEFIVKTTAPPVYSSAIFGGVESATIACELSPEQYINALGGILHIHGSGWRGIVTRRPGRDEPMLAKGLGWVASWNRAAVTFTDVHIDAAADDVLDEVDTAYLPAGAAYRAWMQACDTHITIPFAAVSAEAKFAELVKYAAYDYGWYEELVSGARVVVPHFTARSTTPDYVLKLSECESYDLDECALDELESGVLVTYDGGALTVTDPDETHPLNIAGIVRYGDLTVATTSSTAATLAGGVYLQEKGRKQVKGSVTTRTLATVTGAKAYLPSVRPGRMLRVYGVAGGQADAIIQRATMTGDGLANMELDNAGYRLDIMLARLAANK